MPRLVAVDPGHGGLDPGAIGTAGIEEKAVVLKVGVRVEQYLHRMNHEVLLTRRGDQTVSLSSRADRANQAGAGLFVSIHANSYSDPQTHGLETWHSRPVDSRGSASGALAYCVQRWLLVTTNRRDRGLRYTDDPAREFTVLRSTAMPAILVELAFLSNPGEARLLSQDWYLEKAALGICSGVQAFLALP